MLGSRLKYAVTVGRLSSFSRAAEAVGISQSAVTKAIADLEHRLGYPIFLRTPRGAVPTAEGREFLDRAARILADTEELLAESERRENPYKGPLRIGLFPGSIEWLFAEPITALLRRYPAISLEILTGNSERGVQLLARGDVDVACGPHVAFMHLPHLRCEALVNIQFVPFVRIGHPILSFQRIDRESLVQFDFIAPSSSEPYTSTIQQIYEEYGHGSAKGVHVIDYFPTVRRIVEATDSIGVVASYFASHPRFQEKYVAMPGIGIFDPLALCYAVRTHWPVKPSAHAFIVQARQAMREYCIPA